MDDSLDNPAPSLELSEPSFSELERRIHALEESVVRLENTEALEERIVARVTERLPQAKAPPERDDGIIEDRILARIAERMPPPASAPLADQGDRFGSEPFFAQVWGGGWSSWLFVDMYREAKLMVRMTLDRRYRMAWTTKIIVLLFLPVILTTHWWLPLAWLPFAGGLFVNIVNLVLAFALYRALSREARRYNESERRG